MVLDWNDVKSFRNHLEVMKAFRKSHDAVMSNSRPLRDTPTPYVAGFRRRQNHITSLTDIKENAILIPFWEIAAPPGSQN